MSDIRFQWQGSEPKDSAIFETTTATVFLAAKIGSVMIVAMILIIASMIPPLPETVIIWWEENECWWFNGTIEDKWIEENDGIELTKNYRFLVNGTLSTLNETNPAYYTANNTTRILVVINGDAFDYEYFDVGMTYEGYACDSVPLREAVLSGTIEFLLWASGG
jgi:hypothetical protein